MKVTTSWKKDLEFSSRHMSGHTYKMDAKPPFGKGAAATPKELVLMGLAGCTGMDVVDFLKKSRIPFEGFDIEVEAESSKEHPIVFTRIHLKYIFSGNNPPEDKIQRAVALSQEKYCGVSAMLKRSAEISYEIIVK